MNSIFKLFLTMPHTVFPPWGFVTHLRILKAFQRFIKHLLNFHSACPFTLELESLFDCLFVILSNAINKSQKQKFYEIYLEKFGGFYYYFNAASNKVEAFSLNFSIQIWHQILLFGNTPWFAPHSLPMLVTPDL